MLFVCSVYILFIFGQSSAKLWPRGVVHYSINPKDYDLHSQDEIVSTLEEIEKEICIKFFAASANYNATTDDPILYITNKDKSKSCPSQLYDFSKPIVEMAVGYKCLDRRTITKIVVNMLRASVNPLDQKPINSESLSNTFKQSELDKNQRLLSPNDRNYINGHYHNECQSLSANVPVIMRRTDDVSETLQMDEDNKIFYKDLVWPLGVVLYAIDPELVGTQEHAKLKFGMTSIETASCIVFEEIPDSEQKLKTKNYLYFTKQGADEPQLGFKKGPQPINLKTMTEGAAGHHSHVTNNLMRALGIPMMSNRFDRDNYIHINWKKVEKGRELFLEKTPSGAWIKFVPYDFESVTHAPINFKCGSSCDLGERTVNPMQDHMWGRVMKMGKSVDLSEADRKSLDVVYGSQCGSRYFKTD